MDTDGDNTMEWSGLSGDLFIGEDAATKHHRHTKTQLHNKIPFT